MGIVLTGCQKKESLEQLDKDEEHGLVVAQELSNSRVQAIEEDATGQLWIATFRYNGIGQRLMAVTAYVSIVYVMFNGASRLERRQMARYGNDAQYKEYADKTPIIIPFLPVYHLN